MTIRNQR